MHDNVDTKSIRYQSAIELARYKMKREIEKTKYPSLSLEDVNEIMLVAGVPMISEDELEVVEFTHNEKEDADE